MHRPSVRHVARAVVFALAGLALLSTSRGLRAAEPDAEFLLARDALAGKRYDEAIRLFEVYGRADRAPELRAEAELLLARARLLADRGESAVDGLRLFLDASPGEPWATRARLLVAEALLQLDRPAAASDIYRARLAALEGDSYRESIAAYYLEIADPAYEGVEEDDPDSVLPRKVRRHDYPTALRYYEKARTIRVPSARADEIAYRIARSRLEIGQFADAVRDFRALLAKPPADGSLDQELRGEGLFGLASALVGTGDHEESIRVLSSLETELADHARVPEAVKRIGELQLGLARARSREAARRARFAEAIATWDRFLSRYPQHDLAADVAWSRASALTELGEVDQAVQAHDRFTRDFARDDRAPEARLTVAGLELARQRFDEAIASWRSFLGSWPSHPKWSEAQQSILSARYEQGVHLAEVAKRPDEARRIWEEFLRENPLHELSPEIHVRLHEIELPVELREPVGPRITDTAQQQAIERSLIPLRSLYGKYADSPRAAESRLRVARFLHFRLDRLDEAIAEYEALVAAAPRSGPAQEAARALTDLKRKHLRIETRHASTSATGWRLHIETRNIPRLRFKAYRLNLEDYYRRKLAVERVEDVVVGVVEPTKSWEENVGDYAPFRLLAADRDLPLDGSLFGAFIVTVEDIPPEGSEEAVLESGRGPLLIATTLLLRSDVSFITKHSTHDTLLWAFDPVTGEPADEVRVLVANGSKVLAEGRTDERGIWRWRPESGVDARDARILAAREATTGEGVHYAVDRSSAPSVASSGYTTKVHVTTDRPLYRPGQEVHFRAILREAAEGAYRSSEGHEALVLVESPLGVTLYEETLTAGPFGTVEGSVRLTEEPALGEYRVRVRYRELDFAGTFRVEEYRKPDFTVDLETERRTYLPGEAIRGEILTRYLFGAPVVDAQVRYRVFETTFEFDAAVFEEFRWFFAERTEDAQRLDLDWSFVAEGTGSTNAEGKLPFEFQPAESAADRRYVVALEATDLSRMTVLGSADILVDSAGLHIIARADRRVYRPGDRAVVSFRTVDGRALPVDAEGTLTLLRRVRREDGEWIDAIVRSEPFATSDGLADARLVLEEAGEYRLVLATRDRVGTLCEGGVTLTVAGETPDPTREARLLAEKTVYRSGERATLHLSSPVTRRHALLTFEATGIIDYLVLPVTSHGQEITVDMKSDYSPNVHVAIAIPGEETLHEASDEVIVLQFLDVAVRALDEDGVVAPGDELELELTATDQGGSPVEAELSLGVVDASIFELAPSTTPPIKPWFYDQRRPRGVATGSSLSFRYEGVTSVVDTAVAEIDLALEEAEEGGANALRRPRLAAAEKANDAAPEPPGAPAAGARRRQLGRATARSGVRGGLDRKASSADADGFALGDDAVEFESLDAQGIGGGAAGAFGARFKGAAVDKSLGLPGGPPVVEPRRRYRFADTALWSPSVRTGADGKARVRVELPDNLTQWRVTSVGATRGSLFGSGETSFRAAKGVLVRLEAPRFLTRADRVRVSTPVHNHVDEALDVRVELETDGIEGRGFTSGSLRVPAGEARAPEWELKPPPARRGAPEVGAITVRALSRRESDSFETTIPIVPFGVRRYGGDGGELLDAALYDLELPASRVPGATRVEVAVFPHHTEALLDSVLWLSEFPYGCVEQTISGFLPTVAVADALERLGAPREDLRARLREIVPLRITRILELQRPSGGWSWWGRQGGSSDAEMTALALHALETCRAAGYRVPAEPLERARAKTALLASQQSSRELQALLSMALGASRRAPTEVLQQLYRYRDGLSPRALALAALAHRAHGATGAAQELIALLGERVDTLLAGPDTDLARGARRIHPRPDLVESLAWCLLAIDTLEPRDARAEQLASRLARRPGAHWGTTKATAAAVTALARHAAKAAAAADASVDVLVGGELVASLKVTDADDVGGRRQSVLVPVDRLRDGRNRVELRRRGSGALGWTIQHVHFEPAERVEESGTVLRVARRLEAFAEPRPRTLDPLPAPRADPTADPDDVLTSHCDATRVAGAEAAWLDADEAPAPGHRTIVEGRRPRAEPRIVERAAPGEKIRVRLTVRVRDAVSYVVVEDPIPAGCEVVQDSDDRFSGSFDRREVRDDRVAFFFSSLAAGQHEVTYLLRPTFPGEFRVLPTSAWCMYEPAIVGTSTDHSLEITSEVAEEPERREPTPDEILWRLEREHRRLRGGRPDLESLAALRDAYVLFGRTEGLDVAYRDLTLVRSTSIAILLDRHRAIVEGVEELRRRNPRLVRGRGDIAATAEAYLRIEEHAPAIAWQRRHFDALYQRDREVGETLFERGQHLRAQTYGLELAATYPASSRVVADTLALASRYSTIGVERVRAGRKTVERLDLDAAEGLSRFVGYFPTSSQAPSAQLLLIRALERLGEQEWVVEESRKFAERYPSSSLLDQALWASLRAEFERGRHESVIEAAPALIDRRFPRDNGKDQPSEHVDDAKLLLAKSWHIRGDLERAVALYGEIRERFPDAAETLAHLTRVELSAESSIAVPLEEPATLPVVTKNVSTLSGRVYRVDLPRLFAVQKDVSAASAVDLTGIDPVASFERQLDASRWTRHEGRIDIPTEAKGAYLVVLESEGVRSSTVVVRSDLRIDVRRLGDRLRVHVSPRLAADVKISDGSRIVAKGRADARGIFEATGVGGSNASVLVEHDGHYAIWSEKDER